MESINLDFDDDLEEEAKLLNIMTYGGVNIPPPLVDSPEESIRGEECPALLQIDYAQLEYRCLLAAAGETYGETNSRYSQVFCVWLRSHYEYDSTVEQAKEVLNLVNRDKDRYSARYHILKRKGITEAWLFARWNACFCATSILRATINKLRGLPYTLWLERTAYRIGKAEADIKGNR